MGELLRRVMAKKTKGTNTRNGKNRALLIGIFIVIFLIMAGIFSSFSKVNDNTDTASWSLDESSLLSVSGRTLPAITVSPLEETVNCTLEKISYQSDDTMVYGLLRLPREVQIPPVVIVLPAATVTKEGDSAMADALCSFGYASLTLDERGNGGETQGVSPMDLQTGYTAYRNREMPAQYAQIYDVLLAYDYLQTRKDLDGDAIAVLGESMGGRFAIITAGIEPGIKGAFVVSSGPYGVDAGNNPDVQRFITSIEPESYLLKLPPRPLVMFHFTDDPIIPLAEGKALYNKALSPKAWHQYNGTVHGVYSETYAEDLHAELKEIFGR
jgi:dienelactone hydrolase